MHAEKSSGQHARLRIDTRTSTSTSSNGSRSRISLVEEWNGLEWSGVEQSSRLLVTHISLSLIIFHDLLVWLGWLHYQAPYQSSPNHVATDRWGKFHFCFGLMCVCLLTCNVHDHDFFMAGSRPPTWPWGIRGFFRTATVSMPTLAWMRTSSPGPS